MKKRKLLGIGDLAKRFKSTHSKMYYVLGRGRIDPTFKVGSISLFTSDQLPEIEAALESVRTWKTRKGADKDVAKTATA